MSPSRKQSTAAALVAACALHAVPTSTARLTSSGIPCAFPDQPQFPERPVCPPTTLTVEDAHRLAWRFAPELRFHPLEDSFLVDPADWFADAVITAPEALLDTTATKTCSGGTCTTPATTWPDLLASPQWDSSSGTSFSAATSASTLQNPALSQERKQKLIEGASFTRRGRSTAKMTYSMFTEQDGNAWVFNYHPFYGWNGCSNQAFATPLFGSFFDVEEYYLCPIGAHEFDLEHIGVYVCPADLERNGRVHLRAPAGQPSPVRNAIRRVQYSQHAWLDEMDCEAGECPFEEGAASFSKLVAYSGLFSHALYPSASSLWVYAQGGVDSLEIPPFLAATINSVLGENGQEGIFIADRTAGSATAGRRWVPRSRNLRYLPPLGDITATSADAWAAFPGSWGINQVTASITDFALTCVSGLSSEAGGHTTQDECKRFGAAYRLVQQVTNARDAEDTFDAIDVAAAATLPQPRTSGRTGPLFREYATAWQAEEPAPIWDQDEDPSLRCPGA
eukprot:jgi/Ulvmu1/3402/UM016_0019.1